MNLGRRRAAQVFWGDAYGRSTVIVAPPAPCTLS